MKKNNIISDELLAAYLDGNTSKEETLEVLKAIKNDSELKEALGIAMSLEEDSHPATTVNLQSVDELPMMRMAAESGENICSVLCEAYILQRRHIGVEKDCLLATAREHHWLRPNGVPLHAIGQLLSHHGLIVSRKYDGSLDAIAEALGRDNDVIVAVDSDKLYPNIPDEEDAANHAVVVTAIDKHNDTVTIYDPQHNRQGTIISYQFNQAWRESCYYMVCVLQSVEEYTPQPIYLDYIPLTDDLIELREAIAENAHDVWAAARIKEGWTYGPERDDEKKKHPDLIPYSALPDSEKEYDRIMAFDTIKLVRKLGFNIVKRTSNH